MTKLATLVFIAWQTIALFNYSSITEDLLDPEVIVNDSAAITEFQQELDTLVRSPLLESANVGIKIISLHTGTTLYEHNSHKLYLPASTMKLLTAAVALVELTPNYQFTTHLYVEDQSGDSVSNLYLRGTGDPCLRTEHLQDMLDTLLNQGVTTVSGDIIVDETHFDSLRQGKGWMWDDGPFGGYYAEISALSLNNNGVIVEVLPGTKSGNTVRVNTLPNTDYLNIYNRAKTIANARQASLDLYMLKDKLPEEPRDTLVVSGSIARSQGAIRQHVDIRDPALYTGTVLKALLQENNIAFSGQVYHGKVAAKAKEVAKHTSPRLADIISRMNKRSDNLSAELLLKAVGAKSVGTPGTANKGLSAMRSFLKDIGLNPNRYTLADGSGVSRYNLVSADMLVRVLEHMYQNFAVMPEFFTSLAVAGVDGTLQRRMTDVNASHILRAKTGTMSGVSTLAGYTVTEDKELLAFSILISNYPGPARSIRSLQDQIANSMTELDRRNIEN